MFSRTNVQTSLIRTSTDFVNGSRRVAQALGTLFKLHAFANGRRGSVLALGALLMVPLLGFTGIALDTARAYLARARLSQSTDAAALAAGRQTTDRSKAEDAAKMIFKANFPTDYMDSSLSGPTVTFNDSADTVTVAASAVVPTYFVQLLGIYSFTVSSSSEVTRKTVFMDVVMSIDVSGSMNEFIGSTRKIDAAADAARTLVDTMFGADERKDLLKMGLLTWNSNVRILDIGQSYNRSQAKPKIVTPFTNPYTGVLTSTVWFAKDSPVPLLSLPSDSWKGCVHARYLNDGNSGNDADLTLGTGTVGGKEWNAWKRARKSRSDDEGRDDDDDDDETMQCPSQGIQRLTNTRGQIISAIQQVKNPGGNTNMIMGLMWGWRLLGTSGSPFAGDGTPEPGMGAQLVRAIVIMTDGANTRHVGDAYEGYLNGSALNTRTRQAAQNIKRAGVLIYAIQFGYRSGSQETLMKQVASGPSAPYYQYAPDAAGLKEAFEEVGKHLSKLRLSKYDLQ